MTSVCLKSSFGKHWWWRVFFTDRYPSYWVCEWCEEIRDSQGERK